jgi:L-asparaginase
MAGDDGSYARAVLTSAPDGVVLATLGGGHLSPAAMAIWAGAATKIPVVACSRLERGAILRHTYGYAGSEQDLRATGIVPAGFLSPQAARMKLIACLAVSADHGEIRRAFDIDDA